MDGTYSRNTSYETNLLGYHSASLGFRIHDWYFCTYKSVSKKWSNMKHYIIGIVLSWCMYELAVGDIDRMSRIIEMKSLAKSRMLNYTVS